MELWESNVEHQARTSKLEGWVLENTPENLARWIRNPQDVKPDAKMPTLGLNDETIQQIVAYLESLK